MKQLTGAEVRESFLSFFETRGHRRLPSASLVPENDPTVLFTGAGMNQFKDMFLGLGNLDTKRVCTAQKCIRVPDLENVGRTPRHHTLFEMLGNFSFGDYFKEECILWEWEWFTRELAIPAEQLVASVYLDDDEAYNIWRQEIGLPDERIFRFGEAENFWPASAPSKGPDGPCGPCSEIYFDADPSSPLPDQKGLVELPENRFTEIGNFVFTQFDRQADGSLPPLPQRNIDVGLGFERIVAVLAGATTNFDTDLFKPYIAQLEERTGYLYGKEDGVDIRLRRISDHVRCLVFALADNIMPANEGRGYVIRKILRRAERDGVKLGLDEPFLYQLAPLVDELMGKAYPEIGHALERATKVIKTEEESFHRLFRKGLDKLEVELEKLGTGEVLRGEKVFELHDTFGFPFDLVKDECRDRNVTLDEKGFQLCMEAQRLRSRQGSQISGAVFAVDPASLVVGGAAGPTDFCGDARDREGALVQSLVAGGQETDAAGPGTEVMFAVDRTPFYAAGGGQVGDHGTFQGENGLAGTVEGTKSQDGVFIHQGRVEKGTLRKGDTVLLEIDARSRRAIERNHTATHLLHAALRSLLGDHVQQAGSMVSADHLRFDFTHGQRLSTAEILQIEDIVNQQVLRAVEVSAREMTTDEATEAGFLALFGEKYGKTVRGIKVGEFSRELCGGTHVRNSGAIGQVKIVSEGSAAAGVRRIEAITGTTALAWRRDREAHLERLATLLKSPLDKLEDRVASLLGEIKGLESDLKEARAEGAADHFSELLESREEVDGCAVFFWNTSGPGHDDLSVLIDKLRGKESDFFALVTSEQAGGGLALVAAVGGKPLENKGHAGNLIKNAARILGGGGGGRPHFAKGQGRSSEGLDQVRDDYFSTVAEICRGKKG